MSWFTQETGTLSPSGNVAEFTLVQGVAEGNIENGFVKFNRLIGSVALYFGDVIAGSVDMHVWHGMVARDSEDAQSPTIIARAGNIDDNMVWLWREPIPWTEKAIKMGAEGSQDFLVVHTFNWLFRGGKGTRVRQGAELVYIVDWTMSFGASSLVVNMCGLELYGSM